VDPSPDRPDDDLDAAIDQVFRESWGRVLASLIGFLRGSRFNIYTNAERITAG